METEQGLFDGTIECARLLNGVVAECAASGGLLAALSTFGTVEDALRRMHFSSTKIRSLRTMLDLLTKMGILERKQIAGQTAYRTLSKVVDGNKGLDGGLQRTLPRMGELEPWHGSDDPGTFLATNHNLLGRDLSFMKNAGGHLTFGRQLLDQACWRFFLTEPMYEFGRVLAVKELVACGRRFLDLACGPGIGIQRLAEFSPEGCEVVGVDRSREMLEEARLTICPGAKVTLIHRDLNTGLPPLPEKSFDGIFFNGAFHFIQDKKARLDEMYRALRPGGLLVLGHNFSLTGFDDEDTWTFYFSILEANLWPVTLDKLESLVTDAGFLHSRRYDRGSYNYLFARRPRIDLVDKPPPASSSLHSSSGDD